MGIIYNIQKLYKLTEKNVRVEQQKKMGLIGRRKNKKWRGWRYIKNYPNCMSYIPYESLINAIK